MFVLSAWPLQEGQTVKQAEEGKKEQAEESTRHC